MEISYAASLRWHYPNQVSGVISAKSIDLAPRAIILQDSKFRTLVE